MRTEHEADCAIYSELIRLLCASESTARLKKPGETNAPEPLRNLAGKKVTATAPVKLAR
jgi:hypothetical protein